MVRPLTSLTRGAQQHGWQQWRREVVARRDAGTFISLPQLELLSRVSPAHPHHLTPSPYHRCSAEKKRPSAVWSKMM